MVDVAKVNMFGFPVGIFRWPAIAADYGVPHPVIRAVASDFQLTI